MPRTEDHQPNQRDARGLTVAAPVASNKFSMPFAPGEVVGGKYEIVKLIGEGGIGFVVSAIHRELGEPVALKFLRPQLIAHSEPVRRFANEARAAAKIKSEHVARVYDVGHLTSGTPFIVMELLAGNNLSEVIRERGALAHDVAVEYVLQACEGLGTAHASGVIHRDVKPENLFLAERLQGKAFIKILDFGISKITLTSALLDHQYNLARTTTALGSPPYMAPEQVRGVEEIDARADIWSLGCVLYELLTAQPAFDAPSLMQICAMVLETTPKTPSEIRATIPAGLSEVVMKCLQKDPDKRFQNTAELAAALVPFAPEGAHVFADRCSYVFHQSDRFRVVSSVSTSGDKDASARGISLGESAITTGRRVIATGQAPSRRPSAAAMSPFFAALAMAALASIYAFTGHRGAASLATRLADGNASSAAPMEIAANTSRANGFEPTVERTSAPAAEMNSPSAPSDAATPSAPRPKKTTPSRSTERLGRHTGSTIPAVRTETEPDVGF